MKKIIIAVDGPSASGKSTVSKGLAKKFGYNYADSGALYRAITWYVLDCMINPSDTAAVIKSLDRVNMEFNVVSGVVTFKLNGRCLTTEIRSEAINKAVSIVSAVPEVRERVVGWLRSMADHGSLVMEGRDIGTVVFPQADHKFYLEASSEERARRRHMEKVPQSENMTVTDIKESLSNRDRLDSSRKVAPLKIAADAKVIDTTSMDINQVVDHIASII
jgi:CMP/dCMP kinase